MSPPVRVCCNDDSHAPKVATVGYLARTESGSVYDAQLGRLGRNPSDHPNPELENVHRERVVLRCPLCHITVTMTQHRARRLVDGLESAGVAEVRLSALAASM